MRDWVAPLRTAYFDLFNGNIIIDSSPVPVYQEKVPDDEPNDCYIIIGAVSSANADDFKTFNADAVVDLHFINRFNAEPGDFVDSMVDQAAQLIFPTRTAKGLVSPAGFLITMLKEDSEPEVPITPGAGNSGFIKQRIKRYRQTIVDNN